jgi:DNA processing protein
MTNILFLLQLVFYDRPRLIQQLKNSSDPQILTADQLKGLLLSDAFDAAFRPEALRRLQGASKMVEQMSKQGISWIDCHHDSYPSSLYGLNDAPVGIFYKGTLPKLMGPSLGIVGTRRPSMFAKDRLKQLMTHVQPYRIISGGALGVDAMAHQFALDMSLPTVVVLASGLDVMTPQTNQRLFDVILESGNGLIVSEYPLGVKPRAYYFPQRNRIIAALSHKLLVVEAAKKSGAVITATIGAQLSGEVGALVGGFNVPQSEGCYKLIQDGAHIIGSMQQWLDFLSLDTRHLCESVAQSVMVPSFLDIIPFEPVHIEDLARYVSMDSDHVIDYVGKLALNGEVKLLGQMVYRCL